MGALTDPTGGNGYASGDELPATHVDSILDHLLAGSAAGAADAHIVETDSSGNTSVKILTVDDAVRASDGSGAADGSDIRVQPGRSGQAGQLNGTLIEDFDDHNGNIERVEKSFGFSYEVTSSATTIFEVAVDQVPDYSMWKGKVTVFSQNSESGAGVAGDRGDGSSFGTTEFAVVRGNGASTFAIISGPATTTSILETNGSAPLNTLTVQHTGGASGYWRIQATSDPTENVHVAIVHAELIKVSFPDYADRDI